jgi:hypothetical protein
MKTRFLLMIVVVALAGLLLLSLRQQRISLIHDMSRLHRTFDTERARLWAARAEVAALARPGVLAAEPGDDWAAAVPTSREQDADEAR